MGFSDETVESGVAPLDLTDRIRPDDGIGYGPKGHLHLAQSVSQALDLIFEIVFHHWETPMPLYRKITGAVFWHPIPTLRQSLPQKWYVQPISLSRLR